MPIVTCAVLLAFSSMHCPSPGLQELLHMPRLAVIFTQAVQRPMEAALKDPLIQFS